MKLVMLTGLLVAGAWALPAQAADNVMKTCGAKYQAAKTAKTLPAGQTWSQFLAQCRASLPKAAVAAAATPSTTGSGAKPVAVARPSAVAVNPPKAAGAPSAAMAAMHDRQRQCGAQWKSDKAAGKIPAGQTWPQYWSACSKRLKG